MDGFSEIGRRLREKVEEEQAVDGVPAVVMEDGPAPGLGLVECPHCGEAHVHGREERPLSHRVAHCEDRSTPGRGLGYLILRPFRTLLLSYEWWKDRLRGSVNLGFSGPDDPLADGPGLLTMGQRGASSDEGEQ